VIGGPLNSGILARGAHGGGAFDYGQAPPAVVARVEALDAVCRRFEVPLVAAALQFPGAHPVVVSVIPGPQTIAELNANLASLATPIPGELWAALRDEGLLHPDAPTPAAA
jgi:D-threo-aldose 1-dehydrogenase